MRNHWVKLHEARKRRFYTAEFSESGLSLLGGRRVGVNKGFETGGLVSLTFFGATWDVSDYELIDFIRDARKGMSNWYGRIRLFQSNSNELAYYTLSNLTFDSVNTSPAKVDDILFTFSYGHIRTT